MRLADVCAEVTSAEAERAEAGRDWWPLAIGWAVDGEVPARPAVVARPTDTAQVAAVLALCHQARVPGDRRRRTERGVRRVGAALRRRGPRRLRPGRRDGGRRRLPDRRRPGRHLRARCRDGAPGRSRAHPRALAAVDGPLDRRRLAGLSRRRPVLDPVREDRGHGHRPRGGAGRRPGDPHRRHRAPRRPPGPTSPSCSWAAKAPSGSSPRLGSGCTRCPRARVGGPSASPRSPTGSMPAAGSCAAVPRRPCSGSTTQTESGRSFDRPDTSVLVVLDEADPGLLDATLAVVDEECAGRRAARRGTGRALAGPPQRRVGPGPAVAGGDRGRHHRDVGPLGGAPRALPRVLDALRRLEGTLAASAHQSHAYADGACLYFTFAGRHGRPATERHRRPARPASGPSATTGAAWDAVTERHRGRRRGHQPPPRHRPQPGALPARRPRAGASTCWPRSSRPSTRAASSTRASSGLPAPSAPVPWP